MTPSLPLKPSTEHGLFKRIEDQLEALSKKSGYSQIKDFARHYFAGAPEEEFPTETTENIIKHVEETFNFLSLSLQKKPKIKVLNPSFSRHTVAMVNFPDQPFLVDTVWTELSRRGFETHHTFHPIFYIKRDQHGKLENFSSRQVEGDSYHPEAFIVIEFDRQDKDDLKDIASSLETVLAEAKLVVDDFPSMTAKMQQVAAQVKTKPARNGEDKDEVLAFLEWLLAGHYIFLGYRKYSVNYKKDNAYLGVEKGSGFGILRDDANSSVYDPTPVEDLAPNLARYIGGNDTLIITKALTKSRIHRRADMDYIGVKEFDDQGRVVCEHRFLGLFTSRAYTISPRDIPLVRKKIQSILDVETGHVLGSHNSRALTNILESYPRDELFQITAEQLQDVALGILHLKERLHTRLFVRSSLDERMISAMVFLPRDRLTRIIRSKITKILGTAFHAQDIEYNIHVGDSQLARIFFKIRVNEGRHPTPDLEQIEDEITHVTRSWEDGIRRLLIEKHGEHEGLKTFRRFANVFRAGYQEITSAEEAVGDIAFLERIDDGEDFLISIYRDEADTLHLKVFRNNHPAHLSDIMPILEKMGLYVLEETASRIGLSHTQAWLHDFKVRTPEVAQADLASKEVSKRTTEVLKLVWQGKLENDRLSALVPIAGLEVMASVVMRALVAYWQQVGTRYSQEFIRNALIKHADITAQIWKLFDVRFNPEHSQRKRKELEESAKKHFEDGLRRVAQIDEDVILRTLRDITNAIVRTNAYAREEVSSSLSFKIDCSKVPGMPKPTPYFEIFVYHAAVEGVHLRGGKVARGGLRWSDRLADYRTEVLGLMKTQMTKNTVIVPVGSKGGFVLKKAPCDLKDLGSCDRDELKRAVVDAYKIFVGNLLELTDNIVDEKVVHPENIICHDQEDPYLVVAADKGTATFSDTANNLSQEADFWLDDAFASGGSNGYDHKKMGITAKGAWECVKRHFREMGTNIQKDPFTVIGIGDMGGDVFGNGMLLSKAIKLQAAFNHLHIFIDPDPNPETSYEERKRLFESDYGGWDAYNESYISKGGGIFSRQDKEIDLPAESRKLLKLGKGKLSPDDVVNAILQHNADLLWNGGIGTFVKSKSEDNVNVGDRANDSIRINAHDLNVKVVGEGGNLGMTQKSRIEFAKKGGRINTDAIDNSAGVDCSDHEVNIKILLSSLVNNNKLSMDERNELLVDMTDDVAKNVLYHNYLQSQIISSENELHGVSSADTHRRMLTHLEKIGLLDREVEDLPNNEDMLDRISDGKGLTRPELSVLMAYVKMELYNALLASDLPDDKALESALLSYFPPVLQKKYSEEILAHPLRREIIATVVCNKLVNRMGMTFMYRLNEETGFDVSTIARAFIIARRLYDLSDEWKRIEDLDNKVSAHTQLELLDEVRQIGEHVVLWFLKHGTMPLSIEDQIERYGDGIRRYATRLDKALTKNMEKRVEKRLKYWQKQGLDKEIAYHFSLLPTLRGGQDVAVTALGNKQKIDTVMDIHFQLGETLQVDMLQAKVKDMDSSTFWKRTANQAILESLYSYQKSATSQALSLRGDNNESVKDTLKQWSEKHKRPLESYEKLVEEFSQQENVDHAMLNVALGHLKTLTG